MAAPYKPRKPGSLKEACARLVERCGGQTAAAGLLGCKQQHVARMTDEEHPKTLMSVPQILRLQKHCGARIVTDFMAAEQDSIVEPVHCDGHQPLAMVMGKITSETGELLSAAAQALAHGSLTRAHAATVLRETDDVIGPLVTLRTACREKLEGGAP